MAEEKKTTLKKANELATTIFNSMSYEQRKRLGAPDDRLREINALIEKGDYLSMAHLKKRRKELENWLIDWYKEICKKSLQVPETSKENPDSFTSLEEAAIDYADYARKQPKDYAISSIADYDHGCIDAFKAGAEWQKEKTLNDQRERAKKYSLPISDLGKEVARYYDLPKYYDDEYTFVYDTAEYFANWQKEQMPKWKKNGGLLRFAILEDENGRYVQHEGYKIYFNDLLKLPKED